MVPRGGVLCSSSSSGVLALMRVQLAGWQHLPHRGPLQPGLHHARHGDDVPVRDPGVRAFSIFVLPQMLGTRDLLLPAALGLRLLSYALGGAFFCGSIFFNVAARRVVHVPAAHHALPARPRRRLLAASLSFIPRSPPSPASVELIVGVLKCRPPGCASTSSPLRPVHARRRGDGALRLPPVIAGSLLPGGRGAPRLAPSTGARGRSSSGTPP